MKKIARKLSLLLAVLMIFTAVPTQVFAEESGDPRVVDMPDSETEIDTPDSGDDDLDDVDTPDSGDEDQKEDNGDSVVDEPVADGEELLEEEIIEEEILEAEVVEADTIVEYFTLEADGKTLKAKSNYDPKKLKSVRRENFPDGVEIIPANFFSGNTILTDIELPTSIKTIGESAFNGCTYLNTVRFCDVEFVPDPKDANKNIRKITKSEEVAATAFPDQLFMGCKALKWSSTGKVFVIPKGITSIGEECFSGCTAVTAVTFAQPSKITAIEKKAFYGCTNLAGLNGFENTGITELKALTFYNTKVGEYVTFPNSLTKLNTNSMAGIMSTGTLDLSNTSIATISAKAFVVNTSAGKPVTNKISSIILPSTYTVIGANTFEGCAELTNISLDHVTKVETNAFKDLNKLAEVTLGPSLKTVEDDAFVGCTKLMTITSYYAGADMDLGIDAFPLNRGMTLYGMGGKFEEWAGNNYSQGIIYKPLEGGYYIKTNAQYDGNRVDFNPSTGVSEDVVVTVIPVPGTKEVEAEPKEGEEQSSGTQKIEISKLISLTTGSNPYRFVGRDMKFRVTAADMVGSDVFVNAVFVNTTRRNDAKFTLEATMNGQNAFDSPTEPIIYFENEGDNAQLYIKVKAGQYPAAYSNPWLWSFSSSSGNVTIDANGKIKAIKKFAKETDYALIKAYNADLGQTLQFKVYVGAERNTEFADVPADDIFSFSDLDAGVVAPVAGIAHSAKDVDLDLVESNQTVVVSRGRLNTALGRGLTRDFTATINTKDASDNDYDGTFEWTSSNTSIVKVPTKKTVDDRSNQIKVCGVGEATVTVQRIAKENNKEVKKESYSFTVQVKDMSPYVTNDYLAINAKSNDVVVDGEHYRAVQFDLLSAYGTPILYTKGATVVRKSGNSYVVPQTKWKNKITSQEENCVDFIVDNASLTATSGKLLINVNSQYYKNTSVSGLFLKVVGSDGAAYYVPLPTVYVAPTAPATRKAAVKGKINTFYAGAYSGDIDVEVDFQNGYELATDTAADFELANEPHAHSQLYTTKYAVCDNFAENFEVVGYSDNIVKIRQKATGALLNGANGKPATTGYLNVTYANGVTGSTKITIPTFRTPEKFNPEFTSVVVNSNASGQTFDMYLKNVDKNKTTATITDFTVEAIPGDSTERNKSSADYSSAAADRAGTNNYITFTIPDDITANSTKIVYTVQDMSKWNEPLIYTLNVKRVTTKAEMKPKKTTIEINKWGSDSEILEVQYKAAEMEKYCDNCVYDLGSAVVPEGAENMAFAQEGNNIKVYFTGDVPKKNYSIIMPYTITYNGGSTEENDLRFNVNVTEKKPSIRLKNATFSFNNALAGKVVGGADTPAEAVTTTFTTTNVPMGTPDILSGAKIVDVTDTKNKEEYTYVGGEWKKGTRTLPFEISFGSGTMTIVPTKALEANKNYEIQGAKLGVGTLDPIKFSLRPNKNAMALTVSPKGSLNVLGNESDITYTLKISNYFGDVDVSKINVVEYTDKNRQTPVTTDNFKVVKGTGADKDKFFVSITDDPVQSQKIKKQAYYLAVFYDFDGTNTDVDQIYKTFEITPTQTLPTVTVTQKKFNLYYTDKTATLKTKVVPRTSNTPVTIKKVVFTGKAADVAKLNKQFTITSNASGDVTVKIKDPALLQKGKTYSLPCEVQYNNQLENVVGPKFNIKVVVK